MAIIHLVICSFSEGPLFYATIVFYVTKIVIKNIQKAGKTVIGDLDYLIMTAIKWHIWYVNASFKIHSLRNVTICNETITKVLKDDNCTYYIFFLNGHSCSIELKMFYLILFSNHPRNSFYILHMPISDIFCTTILSI